MWFQLLYDECKQETVIDRAKTAQNDSKPREKVRTRKLTSAGWASRATSPTTAPPLLISASREPCAPHGLRSHCNDAQDSDVL